MATTTYLANAYVTVGGTNVSDQCSSAAITAGFDSLEYTAMGSTGHAFTKGLQAVEVTLTMFNSYGAGEVEAALAALVGLGTTTIVIAPVNGTPSLTNPTYTITNAMLASFTPINSTVGELATVEATFTGGTYARAIA